MALAPRIIEGASRRRRHRSKLIETRMEEIASVAHIATDYEAVDRRGDLEIETRFQQLYQLADDEPEREAVVAAFVAWQRSEQAEDLTVRRSVDDSVDLLKTNNSVFIDGQFVPSDSDGAA